jgi:hypothetical protein
VVPDKFVVMHKLTVWGMEVQQVLLVKTLARREHGEPAAWTEVLTNSIWLKYNCCY